MANRGAPLPVVRLGRAKFISLLHDRLKYRWLPSPAQALSLTDGLFDGQSSTQSQFATILSQTYREGRLKTSAELHAWLRQNALLKRMFRKSAKIAVVASILEASWQPSWRNVWTVPSIDNEVQLAEFLLLGSHRVLDWLTLPHRRRSCSVTHYRKHAIAKRDGTTRLIESPRPVLKRTQRIIATQIAPLIPVHKSAMGFRQGFGIQDCASPHVHRECVLRMDLKDFFGAIHFGRVRSLFKIAGYRDDVARQLAMLCTAPGVVSQNDSVESNSRLPQGAPTSPGLANAICFRMDRRLAGLSSAADAAYTRYADDLIFSLDSRSTNHVKRLATSVAVIAMEEGFKVNFRKTRIMRSGNVQRVLGMTVNEKLNVPRKQYETLKAILHNCVRKGAVSQNRNAHPKFAEHLLGRISHVASIHPQRGEKLLETYRQVDWNATD